MRRTQMKRIISIILCVALLACVSQLFASVDIMAATRSTDLISAATVGDTVESGLANLGEDFYAKISYTGYNSLVKNISVETSNVNNVAVYAEDYTSKQLWRFIRQSDGSYKIVNMYSGLYLYAFGEEGEQYGEVKVSTDDGTQSVRWKIYLNGSKYTFVPVSSQNIALDVDKGTTQLSDGTNVHLWENNNANLTQIFDITNIITLADVGKDFYAKISYLSDKSSTELNLSLDINNAENPDNAAVYKESTLIGASGTTGEYNNTKQHWRFVRQSDKSYIISNMYNGKYLTVAGKSSGYNVTIQVEEAADISDVCRWRLYSINGKYVFKPDCSYQSVMDIDYGGDTDGTNAQAWYYNETGSQKFSVNKVMKIADVGDDFYANISFVNGENAVNLFAYGDNAVVYEKNGTTQQNW